MEKVTKRSLRTNGFSLAKTALKICPPHVTRVREFVENYVKNDKTVKKLLRLAEEEKHPSLMEGVREALNEYYTKEPTQMFTHFRQWEDDMEEYERETGKKPTKFPEGYEEYLASQNDHLK